MDTRRCTHCGHPVCDHIPLRYVWRPWWRHKLTNPVGRLLGRLPDSLEYI